MNMEQRGFLPSTSGEIREGVWLTEEAPPTRQERQGLEKVEEFYGAGTVLGELGVLENSSRVISIECETPVRVRSPSHTLYAAYFNSVPPTLLTLFLHPLSPPGLCVGP